jgi:hypothetical protein
MLGVTESRCVEPDCGRVPPEVEKLVTWDNEVYGDFLVCPFTKFKPGHMQFVCIDSAKHLVVHSR